MFYMKREFSLSGITPRVCTLCLPDIITRDQISQAFPSIFAYLQAINTGGGKGLGMRLSHSHINEAMNDYSCLINLLFYAPRTGLWLLHEVLPLNHHQQLPTA